MARNLVVCLDGTRNEPETGLTNVARAFNIAAKDDDQLVYYDPGVGTMGARSATTRIGKGFTRVSGLAMGHGIKENLEEAYTWLMRSYQSEDRIYVFGFSRGAYTALALTGLLNSLGLLRSGADNLVPYAVKLYTRSGKPPKTKAEKDRFWGDFAKFQTYFGNPEFPRYFRGSPNRQIHYLGIWDAVKTVGWVNWRARFQEARWPYTRHVSNVHYARHALAIDERRRPYAPHRLDPRLIAERKGEFKETWFAGVHSDVGGFFKDNHDLSDIALHWVLDGAIEAGFAVRPMKYKEHVGVGVGDALPENLCLGTIHGNQWGWAILGLGWHRRVIGPADEISPSVYARVEATRGTATPYRPRLPK